MTKHERSISIFLVLMGVASVGYSEIASNSQAPQENRSGKTIHKIDVKVGQQTSTTSSNPSLEANDPFSDDYNPFQEIQELQTRIQKMFDDSIVRGMNQAEVPSSFRSPAFQPPMNVEDKGDKLVMTLDLPGMKKEDIQVVLKDRILTVSGVRKNIASENNQNGGKKIIRQERFEGSFKREFELPLEVKKETLEAQYKEGVLTIEVEKEAVAAQEPRRVSVD